MRPNRWNAFDVDQEIYRFWESILRKAGAPFRNRCQTRYALRPCFCPREKIRCSSPRRWVIGAGG